MRLNVIFSYHDKEVEVDSRKTFAVMCIKLTFALLLFWKFVNTIKYNDATWSFNTSLIPRKKFSFW